MDDRDDRMREELQSIIGELQQEANDRVTKRRPLEKRWLEDLLQYHGQYDASTARRLDANRQSSLNINLTRPKTDAMAARLMDLLFPTDDRNWGIGPTPVPSLTRAAEEAVAIAEQREAEALAAQQQAAQAEEMAAQTAEGATAPQPGQQPQPQQPMPQQPRAEAERAQEIARQAREGAARLRRMIDEATARSTLMQEEIEDQLNESRYQAACRDVIEESCKLGTGVIEGPVTGDASRKGWVQSEDGQFKLQMSDGRTPRMQHISVWDFFPDMSVANVHDGDGVFVRLLMAKRQLRRLARSSGFHQSALRRLLKSKPSGTMPQYIADLRSIRGESDSSSSASDAKYQVWKYTGPIDGEKLATLMRAVDPDQSDQGDIDPLDEVNAVIWFCQDEILKVALYPLDSDECMYSVFCLVKDEYSPFGYGVPAIIRDPVAALNSAWRAMMDNASIGSGPQIVYDPAMIEPDDGDYTLQPRKRWRFTQSSEGRTQPPFWTFNIPMHQAEMANIIQMATKFIDDMSSMPMIAQGEQGAGVTKTAQGMALLMNSANVVFRRIVKNFDDDFTVPNIRRLYDWNMQFSEKEEIKGDYNIDARGSSVLLAREMQSQNLMMIAMQLGAHPIFGPMLKNREVLRKLFQSMMIPSTEVMLSDDEIDAIMMQASATKESEEAALRREEFEVRRYEIETRLKIAAAEADARYKIAEMQYQAAMESTAMRGNERMEDAKSRERVASLREQGSDRRLAAEAAFGPTGGGAI